MPAPFSLIPAIIGVVVLSSPEQIMPANQGMTWHYNMIEESGPSVRLSDESDREAGILQAKVVYRMDGTEELDGKKMLKFEMHRAGRITNTDLMTVDEIGVRCWARIDDSGQLTMFDSPQPMVASPITVGHTWDFETNFGGTKVHQHYEIVGEAEIDTPAGTFRAFHIRCEQSIPGKMTIDRWFAPGVGIVKDVTETHSDTGELLRRITLELTEEPKVAERPQIKVRPELSKLRVTVGPDAVGESRNAFLSVTPKICARWQGRGLQPHSKIRARWIAEEVEGVAPPDYTIDEATTFATLPDSHGVFTLGRPEGGWTPGTYRVEFYVNSGFVDSVKLRIIRPAAAAFEH